MFLSRLTYSLEKFNTYETACFFYLLLSNLGSFNSTFFSVAKGGARGWWYSLYF